MRRGYWVVTIVTAVVVVAAAITIPIVLHENGIYAGFAYGDGVNAVEHIIADKYGLEQLNRMRLAKPPVVKTHLNEITQKTTKSNSFLGSGQVRVYHLIGYTGVRWCVGIWDWYYHSGSYYYGRYFIIKGCRW